MSITQYLEQKKAYIDQELENYSFKGTTLLEEACTYALTNGGKRLRPILSHMVCDMLGKDFDSVLPFAIAIEFIHAYSLVHDDMPCMDNDVLRRGKPTVHVEYGEDMALLAGDTLLTHAFAVMLNEDKPYTLKCMREITNACGIDGMLGGQLIDLLTVRTEESLYEMDTKKTGALIKAAVAISCIVHDAPEDFTQKLLTYAEHLGLAFQIKDDLLDIQGNVSVLGKNTGADAQNGRTTYVTVLGEEKATERLNEIIQKAKQAIEVLDNNQLLLELADYVKNREK